MKALVYHGPDQRSWDNVDDPGKFHDGWLRTGDLAELDEGTFQVASGVAVVVHVQLHLTKPAPHQIG